VQDIDAKVLTPLLTAITPLVAGATAAPLQAVAESLANITMNVISDINTKIESLPKILSRVVEIE
jgi:glucose-6-phosphate dehydrogenase assembly protein OpcA